MEGEGRSSGWGESVQTKEFEKLSVRGAFNLSLDMYSENSC